MYAQAIDRVEGGATAGDEVRVVDPRNNFLGRGFYSPGSAIPVRILLRDEAARVDGHFFHARITRAEAARRAFGLPGPDTNGYRVVHAEGDELPGLIVDRFGDVLVIQLLTFGMKVRESLILQALVDVLRPKTILDRTPATMQKLERFEPGSGVVLGEETNELVFLERRLRFRLPLDVGQKTGFYFDQRGLRARVEELANGKTVLDAYSFVGAFAMAAARGGAKRVTAVDQSGTAVEVGAECARLNGLEGKIDFVRDDAKNALADAAKTGGRDLVLLDPPRLAPTRGARENALVAYARVAEAGCRATKAGGLLVLSSCSSAVDMTALVRALATGALRANRQAIVLERTYQGHDHPTLSAHGEGLYLKSVLARVEKR